ncbi:Manganese ABC transporter, inner membrane permease protein SitD [hydrothermal vent metagenome]|uniref:Manganese ABC transporter, inner membrane permease protein SitD n=1 Tax=hydrothermal vent metagenome TaxID=652676 RepID=A0A3B1D2G8_9ZZZZ
MSTHQIDIIILAVLISVTCAIPGVFLVLRRVALMSDAISHAILLGIVVAFLFTKNLTSPLLIFGATLTGVLTVTLTEIIIKTRKLKKDAAIGLVFPLLFSIGVILLNIFARDVHLDSECVLFGEIAFTPFNRLIVNGMDLGPQSSWVMGGILLLNVLFVFFFYKELKVSTFDSGLAASLGFFPGLIHYFLMTIVSITTVGAFESVGSILVVALMITPPAAAYLLTNRLSHMIFISCGLGALSAIGGYFLAYKLDASISGSMAVMSGIIFIVILIFAPERGLLAKIIVRKWTKWDFAISTLAVHLLQAEADGADATELITSHMHEHMLWSNEYTSEVIAQCIHDDILYKEENTLILTSYGREKASLALSKS